MTRLEVIFIWITKTQTIVVNKVDEYVCACVSEKERERYVEHNLNEQISSNDKN